MSPRGTDGEVRRLSAGRIVSALILVAATAVLAAVLFGVATKGYASFFGYSCFRVATGSMEPTLPVGTLLIVKRTAPEKIAVGEIITFLSPDPSIPGKTVTHRVAGIAEDGAGGRMFETRGDANPSSDRYFVRGDAVIGRVVRDTSGMPGLTSFVNFASSPRGFLAVTVLPIAVIAGFVMSGSVSGIRKELRSISAAEEEKEEKTKTKKDGTSSETEAGASSGSAPETLPGYRRLTAADYDEIYRKVKSELEKEIRDSAEGSGSETEYPDGSRQGGEE